MWGIVLFIPFIFFCILVGHIWKQVRPTETETSRKNNCYNTNTCSDDDFFDWLDECHASPAYSHLPCNIHYED